MFRPCRILSAALVLVALASAGPVRAAAAPADTSSVVEVVSDAHTDSLLTRALDRMAGVIPGSDTLVAWDVLRAHAERTVDLVLPTLKPVRRSLYLGAPNMVWRIRVLQRLTGLEFVAPTRKRLTAEEAKVLRPDSLKNVRFAGENRDRGMTWAAPADAQKAIIEKWREWWAMDQKKPRLPMKTHSDERTWWY